MLFACVLLAAWGCRRAACHLQQALLQNPQVAQRRPAYSGDRSCAPLDQIPIQGANLTVEELQLLPDICWPLNQELPTPVLDSGARGVPAGVQCDIVPWCDEGGHCTDVCKRGSVQVDEWLQHSIQTQLGLSRRLPFCYAPLLGTHNSGITLADGYGNLDPQFGDYFQWIKWVATDPGTLRTNDQWFSLTDQMQLGVRVLELDTHWFAGDLRIAHCGGYHSDFDTLIKAINVIAKLLHLDIRWDSETIGCEPSLSSIPVKDQRTLTSALEEVRDWLDRPGNEREFVVMFFDDQEDLQAWEMVPNLLSRVQEVFPLEQIWTPPDMEGVQWTWPSIDELVDVHKKRVMFLSGVDYGREMNGVVFSKGAQICDWAEPGLKLWGPGCQVNWGGGSHTGTMQGQILRVISCELTYGPMNCDFAWGLTNEPLLDEATLPDISLCALNMPSPDLLTPSKVAATIWSWAPGHPMKPYAAQWWLHSAVLRLRDAVKGAWRGQETLPQCTAISAADGRWRARNCKASLPTACRAQDGSSWQLGAGSRGKCPAGFAHEAPHHAKENTMLQSAVQQSQAEEAWLPIQGPKWQIPSMAMLQGNGSSSHHLL